MLAACWKAGSGAPAARRALGRNRELPFLSCCFLLNVPGQFQLVDIFPPWGKLK